MATFVPNVTDLYPEPALYKPDFSFLDTMLRRRQAMYNQGFSEISSKYSALAKNLTNPYNSQVRNQFLTEAQNQLKNLSAMDLSQQQNVQAAANVFTPLYKDRNVMSDLALTSHWDQQEKIAESLRLKDGGKEYSDDNIQFVRMQRNAFAQDRPESAGFYEQSKRYFTPYHDYSKEVMEAMKEFKPSSYKSTLPDGRGYMVTDEKSYINSEEVKLYLSNVLSEKAKNQMNIEGVVRYSNNPAILNQYTKGLGQTERFLKEKIVETEGKILGTKDDVMKKELQSGLEMLKTRLEDINLEKTNMSNPEYLTRNRDSIASRLYYSDKIEDLSKSFGRTISVTREMKPDDVYLTRLREAGLDRRHRETLADNRLLKQVDLGMLTFDTRGNIVRVPDQQFITPTGEIKPGTGYAAFQQQKQSVIQAQTDARENLKKFFYESNPQFRQQGIEMNDSRLNAALDQFITEQTELLKTNPKSNKINTRFLQFKNTIETSDLQLATLNEKERRADEAFGKDVEGVIDQVKNIFGSESKEITLYDSKTRKYTTTKVTPKQFVQIFMNSKSLSEDAFYNEKDKNYIVEDSGLQINIDGKKVQFMAGSGKEFKQAFDLLKKNKNSVFSAANRFNQMYDQAFAENETMLRPINEKDPLVIAAKNDMQNATLVPADNIVISGYNKGKYMFGFKTGVKKENLASEEEMAAMGIKRAPGYTDENPKFVVESSLFSPRTGEVDYTGKEKAIVDYFTGVGNATENNREIVYGTPTGLITIGEGLNPVQVIKTSRYGQPDSYDVKDELTGIFINKQPRTLDQVIEIMRQIEADPLFLTRMRNYKP